MKVPFTAMGSGTLAAMSVLEGGWKEDMEEEEAKKLVRYESYLYFLICSPLISRNFCIFTLFSINTNRYLPFCRYGRYIDRYWVPI